MDLGTILTATIMLSICVLPFILMNRKKKRRIKKLQQNFMDFISEKGQNIGENEICGDFVIGLDNISKHLYFIKQNQSTDIQVCIPINTITDCKLEKIYEIDSNSMDQSTALDKVLLTFTTKEAQSKNKTLILFDSDDQMQLDGELQLGEKWSKIIQAII